MYRSTEIRQTIAMLTIVLASVTMMIATCTVPGVATVTLV